MSHQVIVIGMHRSGSSLVANLLHRAGIRMGERLVRGKASNIDGHFEDWEMVSINEGLLGKLGATWDSPPLAERVETLRDEIRSEYSRYAAGRNGCWGVKDPRLNIFLPYLDPLLDSPFYVYCVRDAAEVAKSLKVREGMDEGEAVRLKQIYDGMCEDFLRGKRNFIAVNYGDLIRTPEIVVGSILSAIAFISKVDMREIVAPVRGDRESLNKAKRKMLIVDVARSGWKAATTPSLLSFSRVTGKLKRWARELLATFE